MPDPNAKDPHTAEFDQKGRVFFTLQVSNMIGRLIPATGEIKLVTLARKNSRPYGIKVARDGSLWVSCNGSNCVLNVDPETLAVKEFNLPEGTTVRRLDLADDGMIWYVNSGLGRLGRLDPKIRTVQGVGVAQRPEVSSLRHRGCRRRRLVQRVGAAS